MADAHLADSEHSRPVAAPVRMRFADFAASHRGIAFWATGVLVLLTMAALAHGAAQFPGDAAISTWFQQIRGTAVAAFLDFPSNANQPLPGAVIAFAIIAALAILRQVIEAVATAVATFGTDLVNVIINSLVARPRPHNVHVSTIGGLGGYSFPSGHVAHVTALFGFVFFLTLLIRRAHPQRWAWLLPFQVICVYFIALVGVGRVVEGVHQPSDVLAGYLVGALTLPLAILFYYWLVRRWQRHHQRKMLAHIGRSS